MGSRGFSASQTKAVKSKIVQKCIKKLKQISMILEGKKYTILGQNYTKMVIVTCQIHTISIYSGLFEQENCVV